jgi:hypothetical protein
LDIQEIVKELKAERNRLDKAIAALDGANNTGATVATVVPASGIQAPRKRRRMSAARRNRLSMVMKQRWAERKKKDLAGQK